MLTSHKVLAELVKKTFQNPLLYGENRYNENFLKRRNTFREGKQILQATNRKTEYLEIKI